MPRTKRRNADDFVPRVVCNGILKNICEVCCKEYIYTKGAAHKECYKRQCSFCILTFKTKEHAKEHALKYHKKTYCEKCEQVFEHNYKEHIHTYHFVKKDTITF